jgi:hypothetical protein
MERSRRDDETGLRKVWRGLATILNEEAPFENYVFTDGSIRPSNIERPPVCGLEAQATHEGASLLGFGIS